MSSPITVVGGGLAGCEAAWRIAQAGFKVRLFEMRPKKMTSAHRTGLLAELVCSNSLKSNRLTNACGVLKEEMRLLGSLTMAAAEEARVPAGDALAVDRDVFAEIITRRIENHTNITVIREEIKSLDESAPTIVASGPLTSEGLSEEIVRITGSGRLYFYDAIAPSIEAESIDRAKVYSASRYNREGSSSDYLNCPLTMEEYDAFIDALCSAERVPVGAEEDIEYFEGCLPIEVLASRGRLAAAYGPMKPVGLKNPDTGERPWAVVQLRQENLEGTIYGMVGFQTRLKYSEQERVFRMIPGLERAVFVRFGSMHRNTYLDAPRLLDPTLQLRGHRSLFFAGQITGVEGYVESAATGIIAGINAVRLALELPVVYPPEETMLGSLLSYISSPDISAHIGGSQRFQPINALFGLMKPLDKKIHSKRDRYAAYSQRAIESMKKWSASVIPY